MDFAEENSWTIREVDTGMVFCESSGYVNDYASVNHVCCLPENSTSALELTCTDSHGDGWHGAYIYIDGVSYCQGMGGFNESWILGGECVSNLDCAEDQFCDGWSCVNLGGRLDHTLVCVCVCV
jgi:hypothetical protein